LQQQQPSSATTEGAAFRQKPSSPSPRSESELDTDEEASTKNGSYLTCKKDELNAASRKLKSILKTSKLVTSVSQSKPDKPVAVEEVFEKIDIKTKKPATERAQLSKAEYDRVVVGSGDSEGFAKILPINQPAEVEMVEASPAVSSDEAASCEFISRDELENNRMKMAELRQLPQFKNYERGETNSRLYLKNLAKKVTELDLKRIYGRYVDWKSETDRNAFDIRLMQEGKMKGQAFITFPSEAAASKALNDTNGFLLDSKPIIVQFARSAKPSLKPN
jgi:U11/U12 small nuclear ribonucleoprotein SNRNP65